MKFIAMFKRSVQISPDDFDVWHETKICDEHTTLGEIHEWMRGKRDYEKAKLHIEISQADEEREDEERM